ncbi:MAG: hypothetical protein OXC44_05370 [Proteobacteria bacterium]|nr:hypothetical protein [Pseudomonadota bacterium]
MITSQETLTKARIGWAYYVNVFPVISLLSNNLKDHDVELIRHYPKHINTQFRKGELDIALCSTVTLLHHPHSFICSHWGVCSHGAVKSVYLASQQPNPKLQAHIKDAQRKLAHLWRSQRYSSLFSDQWTSLEHFRKLAGVGDFPAPSLDLGHTSEASAALALIFYKLWFGSSMPHNLDEAHRSPLKLYIGDEALFHHHDFGFKVDISSTWSELTGLPFVFAAWLASSQDTTRTPSWNVLTDCIDKANHQAKEVLLHSPEYFWNKLKSSPYGDTYASISKETMLEYWQTSIHYSIGAEEKQAIKLYLSLASEVLPSPHPTL